jgi:hypothetical protein
MQGTLLNEHINMVNVYGPNEEIPNSLRFYLYFIASFPGKVLMAGNFNCTLDPHLDGSSGLHTSRRVEINYSISLTTY